MAKSQNKRSRPATKDDASKKAPAKKRSKGRKEELKAAAKPQSPPVVDKGGRPSMYTEALAIEVCEHIADGLSLRSIQAIPGMPAKKTVLRWALEDREGFRAHYVRARELQLESEADEIVDISDDGRNDWMERETRAGSHVVLNKEAVDRSKLRVATRQWRLARLMQGKYGDKIKAEHSADEAFVEMLKRVSGEK